MNMNNQTILKNDMLEVDHLNIIHTYRYLSWFFTSVFYFFTTASPFIFKFGVIFSLYISANVTIKAYKKCDNKTKIERAFIFIESIGITLLLLPTGGLTSPFIWYALNPVLISAIFSLYYFCWFDLLCYLSTSTIISYLYFNPNRYPISTILTSHSHLILIFILITLAVQLLTILTNKLKLQSNELMNTINQLNQANKRTEESLQHIMSLYQVVEALTVQDNQRKIYEIFTEYTMKVTKTDLSFFWIKSNENELDKIVISGDCSKEMKDALLKNVKVVWKDNMFLDEIIYLNIEESNFYILNVKSSSRNFGIIGVKTSNFQSDCLENGYIKHLEFISKLSGVILERFQYEEITDRLILAEEQNRIANEMHDSVAQRLFGISCTVHTMMANWESLSKNQIEEKLDLLQDASHSAMKELRSAIYKLSSRKGGIRSFQTNIKNYLDSVSKLNNVTINFKISGDEELIDISKKRGMYRIICEAIGNAIRHGKCSRILMTLIIENKYVKLTIIDDGKGFEISKLQDKEKIGLGLQNMKNLVKSFDGSFDIRSEVGCGSVINVCLSNTNPIEINKGDLAI